MADKTPSRSSWRRAAALLTLAFLLLPALAAGQSRPRGAKKSAEAPPAAAEDAGLARALRQVERHVLAYSPQAARDALGEYASRRQDPGVLVALGRILILERQYEAAQARFEKAARLDPASPIPWAHIGETHLYRKSSGAAKNAFREARDRARVVVEKNPDDAEARYYLGWSRQQLGDPAAAIAALEKARQLDSGNPESLFQMGVCEALRQNWKTSVEHLTAAIELDPDFAYAYYYRGQAASRAGQKDLLIADLQRFLELAPDAPEAAIARRTIAAVRR